MLRSLVTVSLKPIFWKFWSWSVIWEEEVSVINICFFLSFKMLAHLIQESQNCGSLCNSLTWWYRWCQDRSLSVLFILTLSNCSLILRSLYSVGNSSVVKAFNGPCRLNPSRGAQRGFRTGHLRRDALPSHCYSTRACRKTNQRKMWLILLLVDTLRCEYTSMFFSQILGFLK